MTHVRQQLRAAIDAAFADIPNIAAIHTNHPSSLIATDLPAILISTETEESETIDKGGMGVPPRQQRTVNILITVIASGDSDAIDDDLDAIAVEIEKRMDTTFGLLKRLDYTGSALELAEDEDGAQWFGFLGLSFEGILHTLEGQPEATQ